MTSAGNAIDKSRNLLSDTYKSTHGVEQHKGEECDGEESEGMSYWKKDNVDDKSERSKPPGYDWLAHRLHLLQRPAYQHRILVSASGSTVKFDRFGNLTKALAFPPERAAGVAECGVSKHVGLIHALDAGHDLGPQQ